MASDDHIYTQSDLEIEDMGVSHRKEALQPLVNRRASYIFILNGNFAVSLHYSLI